ncbi:MAG: bifunctional oligoribonuclease/PAP phosphatase NrnA [Deltaproteobacteria bacterium]|jgi:phosphoesterase RecJ-like protein|nr:bifunctional oligoribonuclease/PAP phosphatase NrnA [Deltaproteobacteria bacterium]
MNITSHKFKVDQSLNEAYRPPEEFMTFLKGAKRILIIGHQNPDGDALGSALALGMALKNSGRNISVGYSGILPSSLEFLTGGKDFLSSVDFSPELALKYDLLVMVDCRDISRVWPECEALSQDELPPFLSVDHHADTTPNRFKACFINHQAAATAELIFKILEELEAEFTPPIVESLLAALISDTGSFSQANSTAECLRQASFLVSRGGDIEHINHYIKRNWSETKMRLLTEALATITLHFQGRLATMLVTQEMLDRTGACVSETEGLVEYPLLLRGVDIVALLKVNGHGQTRVSLRSRPGLDVRELAKSQGGGGHNQAAAYIDPYLDPEESLKVLLNIVETTLEPHVKQE